MKDNDNFLEQIRQTETNNLNAITKFFSDAGIESTTSIVGLKKLKSKVTKKEFKPDIFFKVFCVIIIGGILIFVFKQLFFDKNNIPILSSIFELLFFGFLAYKGFEQLFMDKRLNYNIYLDNEQIIVGDKIFRWEDIYQTAILTKPGGKKSDKYLIIALNDMSTYEKFDLGNFVSFYIGGFSYKLSKYIEYFKPPL